MRFPDSFIKCLLLMKLTMFILLFSSFQSIAFDGIAQPRVTLLLENSDLKKAFREIEKQTAFRFIYNDDVLPDEQRVSINVANEPLDDVMPKVLAKTPLTYKYLGRNLIVICKKEQAPLPKKEVAALPVTGRVTDQNGDALSGVSITEKGTTNGTTSRSDGSFSFDVSGPAAVLVFSYVGFEAKEMAIGNGASVMVALTPNVNSQNEVVVVGYATQRRKDISGAVASITSKDFRDLPIANIGQALQGRMPGVLVQQATGAPGSSPSIRVRGLGSITASSSPLLVVDQQILGNLNDLGFINPNDIERIDVLKDASATAIYGARGGNGVILITTKRGRSGTPRVNVDYYTGFQNVTKKVDMLNTPEFVELAKEAYANSGQTANMPAFLNGPLPDIDYQDLVFRTAPMSSYQASVTGGSDKISYLLSGNFLSQGGIVHTSNFDRYSLRANLDVRLNNRLKVGLSLNPTFNNERLVQTDGHWQNYGIVNTALSVLPFVDVYKPDGTYNSMYQYQQINNFFPAVTNPVANIYAIDDRQKTTRFLGNVYGELDIIQGLKYRASFGTDLQQVRRNFFQGSGLPQNGVPAPQPASRVAGFSRSSQNINWLFNQTLNFTRSINNRHNFNVLLGTESQRNDREVASILANNFPNDAVTTVNAGTIVTTFAGFPPQLPISVSNNTLGNVATRSTFFGYFARLGYNYENRYLLDLSVRRDASSRFAADGRWATFPAASVGWVISEEKFLQNNPSISLLKIRASYGLSGNAAIANDYASYGVLTAANYNFNNVLALGLRAQAPDNFLLTWEKSQQFDAGLELGLFRNRVLITADVYNRITKDLLLFTAVPSVSGFTNVLQNIGRLRNRGLELGLTTENTQGAFRWTTSANLSFNRSLVLALGPTGDPIFSNVAGIVGNATRTRIGQPLAMFYGYQQLGVFQSQDEIEKYAKYPAANQPRAGDRKYADVNGDGFINASDQTDLGNSQPRYIYGLTNNFSYKGFDLAVALQGVEGQSVLNFSRRFYAAAMSPGNNLMAVAKDRWRSPTQPGDGMTPRATIGNTGLNNAANSTWVEDASYLTIRNVTLGYTLPQPLASRARINSARIYAGVQNAFIFTDYKGYNPEVSNFEDRDPLSIGIDYGSYPLARTFTFGVQLGF